jgi:hypothetical protein
MRGVQVPEKASTLKREHAILHGDHSCFFKFGVIKKVPTDPDLQLFKRAAK